MPIEVYVSHSSQRKAKGKRHNLPVVIINHGYDVRNTEYSFLAKELAAQGYYVVSIQHDLKTDPSLARTGDLSARRKPLWNRGVLNIYDFNILLNQAFAASSTLSSFNAIS